MSQTLIISFSLSFVARVTCFRLVIVKRSCLPPVLSFYKAWDFLNSIFIPDLGRTDISTSLISRKIPFLIAIFPFSFRFRAAGIKCSKNVRTCERNSSKQSRKNRDWFRNSGNEAEEMPSNARSSDVSCLEMLRSILRVDGDKNYELVEVNRKKKNLYSTSNLRAISDISGLRKCGALGGRTTTLLYR